MKLAFDVWTLRQVLLVDFRKLATMFRTAERSLLGGSATKRRKGLATGKMAMSIWHVRILRQQIMRDVMMLKHGSFSIAS
jgi:hypothetical protein